MKIIKEYPPNYKRIKEVLNPPETACFAYGDTIFNPSGNEIWLDLQEHEQTHERQMKELGPEAWWNKYLDEPEYRKECEVEAYATQYNWINARRPSKVSRMYLDFFAMQLVKLYKLDIDETHAYSAIRLKAKELSTASKEKIDVKN